MMSILKGQLQTDDRTYGERDGVKEEVGCREARHLKMNIFAIFFSLNSESLNLNIKTHA